MTNIDPSVFIRRNKLRRVFETTFRDINSSVKSAAIKAGIQPFFIKYSNHLLDRAIQRDIDEEYVFALFKKIHLHVEEISEFLKLPPLPIDTADIDPDVVYRPQRLEVTDGTLWLGMTVDNHILGRWYSLKCRMAFVNNKRLKGKISTYVINL